MVRGLGEITDALNLLREAIGWREESPEQFTLLARLVLLIDAIGDVDTAVSLIGRIQELIDRTGSIAEATTLIGVMYDLAVNRIGDSATAGSLIATLDVTNRRLLTGLQMGDLNLWRIDNQGDVIFSDSFDGNNLNWIIRERSDGLILREYRPLYVYHQNASVRLYTGSTATCLASISKSFPLPTDLDGVGFEISFRCEKDWTPHANHNFQLHIEYHDGTNRYRGVVWYWPSTDRLRIQGTTTQDFYPDFVLSGSVWNKIKITYNFDDLTFKDLWANQHGYDVSGIALPIVGAATENMLTFECFWYNIAAPVVPSSWWVDDFVLSINEPKVF